MAGDTERGKVSVGMRFAGLVIAVAVLAGCREERLVIQTDFDTTGWVRHCLGYQSFLAPPDFTLAPQATVDGFAITVRPGSPAPLRDVLANRDDYGRTVNAVEVNGWTVVVATIKDDLLESRYSLHLIGARRVGTDIVTGYKDISREDHPEGTDPNLWSWFARTTAHTMSDVAPHTGYCIQNIVLDSPTPEPVARFSAIGGVRGADTMRGEHTIRSDTDLTIMAIHQPPDRTDSDRPLAPGPDISAMPGVDVTAERMTVNQQELGFTTVRFDDDKQSGIWFDAALFGDPARPDTPAITTFKFQDGRSTDEDARAKALAILASIRQGR